MRKKITVLPKRAMTKDQKAAKKIMTKVSLKNPQKSLSPRNLRKSHSRSSLKLRKHLKLQRLRKSLKLPKLPQRIPNSLQMKAAKDQVKK